jgi:serine/threonine-protein kinase
MAEPVRLGRYLLDRRLAVGGMAEIFLGRIPGAAGFEKRVVIKRILPIRDQDERFTTLFINEARVLCRLAHPNLVEVFGFEEIDGQYCLIMEFIEGHDLRALLDESDRLGHPVPLSIAAWLVAEAAAGLHAAHIATDERGASLGVVHRDISPENVIVSMHGRVKVVDFGVAKHSQEIAPTPTGSVMGKACYMSPEQARGDPLDPRTDICALGIVLYELCTRTSPYRRATLLDTISAAATAEPPPLPSLRPDAPAELCAIAARMMARRREDRFDTAGEVADALHAWTASVTHRPEEETREFLHGIFSKTVVTAESSYHVLGTDDIILTGDLQAPDVVISADVYRQLCDRDTRPEPQQQATPADRKTVALPRGPVARAGDAVTAPAGPGGRGSPVRLGSRPRVRLMVGFFATLALGLIAAGLVGHRRAARVAPPDRAAARPAAPVAAPTPVGTGTLRVTTAPPGATVRLDGRVHPQLSPTTVTGISRDAPHELVISKPGYQEVRQELFIAGADPDVLSWIVTLTAAEPTPPAPTPDPAERKATHGYLSLESDPATRVLLRGRALGTTPLRDLKLPAGRHVLQLQARDWGLLTPVEVEIAAGGRVRKKVQLGQGRLAVDVQPWAVVYVCGKKLGVTPLPPLTLVEGRCTVRLLNPSLGVTRELPVVVRAGELTRVVEQLH